MTLLCLLWQSAAWLIWKGTQSAKKAQRSFSTAMPPCCSLHFITFYWGDIRPMDLSLNYSITDKFWDYCRITYSLSIGCRMGTPCVLLLSASSDTATARPSFWSCPPWKEQICGQTSQLLLGGRWQDHCVLHCARIRARIRYDLIIRLHTVIKVGEYSKWWYWKSVLPRESSRRRSACEIELVKAVRKSKYKKNVMMIVTQNVVLKLVAQICSFAGYGHVQLKNI